VTRERGRGDPDLAERHFFAPKRANGEHHVEVLREVVHEDRAATDLGEFKSWLKDAKGFAGLAAASPEAQAAVVGFSRSLDALKHTDRTDS
jgi:hypothetical protein